jgi:hypothetical protein
MAFSYNTKLEIHDNAGGQCECIRQGCSHIGRCARVYQPTINPLHRLLQYAEQYIFPGFEFHHKSSQAAGGANTATNGAFLCSFCHQQTNSYGVNLAGGR